MFPNSMMTALTNYEASFIEIVIDNQDKAEDDFLKIFKERWLELFHTLEKDLRKPYEDNEDYYGCPPESTFPVKQVIKENGRVIFRMNPVYFLYCFDGECELNYARQALQGSIDMFMNEHPDAIVSGYVGFEWSDSHGGDVEQYPLGEEKEIYPFFAEIINEAVELDGNTAGDRFEDFTFGARLREELENIFESEEYEAVVGFLTAYRNLLSEDAIETILSAIGMAAENSDDDEINEAVQMLLDKFSEGSQE